MGKKIRLLEDLPIATEHKAVEGAVFDLLYTKNKKGRGNTLHYFKGATGELCAAWPRECAILEED